MIVGACNIVSPAEDEVIVREDAVFDKGIGGVVEGNGKVTELGSGS